MILDALQVLAEGGFRIRDYQYTGFGSIYFVDFILFHKVLGMNRLLSVEYDYKIEKRVKFNRPFAQVRVEMGPISTYIPKLDRDLRHFLWLDYDSWLRRSTLEDTIQAATLLSPGSILLVTVDVEPPTLGGPNEWLEYYREEAGDLLPFGVSESDYAKSDLGHQNAQILFNAIRNGITARSSIDFYPLFNFEYRDGHRMLTVGGLIGNLTDQSMLGGCNFAHADYLRRSDAERPYEIRVPRLTRKERLLLDHHMPCVKGWLPVEFEITDEDVDTYNRLYRYYPSYAELML